MGRGGQRSICCLTPGSKREGQAALTAGLDTQGTSKRQETPQKRQQAALCFCFHRHPTQPEPQARALDQQFSGKHQKTQKPTKQKILKMVFRLDSANIIPLIFLQFVFAEEKRVKPPLSGAVLTMK